MYKILFGTMGSLLFKPRFWLEYDPSDEANLKRAVGVLRANLHELTKLSRWSEIEDRELLWVFKQTGTVRDAIQDRSQRAQKHRLKKLLVRTGKTAVDLSHEYGHPVEVLMDKMF